MYPIIDIFGIQIFSFGLVVTLCFFLFLWMLHRLAIRLNYETDIYWNNLLWFFLSTFFFSRIFYIISHWNELKYIDNIFEFFFMTDYNFSMIWGLFGFFITLFILVKIRKENIGRYLYGFMLSFLFILPLAYFGALLGGQVYGIDTNYGIEITYSDRSPVPFVAPVFPLPIVYSLAFFLAFCGFYIANMYIRHKVLLGYISLMTFSMIIFILEFFSGKYGLFKDTLGLNISQLSVLALFFFCTYKLYQIYKGTIVA